MNGAVVHLVDDDEAVRQGLAFLLISAGFTVRAHESAPRLLERVVPGQRGCVITDIRMPGMSGLDLQRELAARRIALPVIVMTGHGDVPLAVRAMKEGAVDFIEKPFTDETLLTAVNEALIRCPRAAAGRGVAVQARLASLTPREREVLEALVRGLPNKMIAYDLGISARTVEAHRANLMAKMEAGSLPELVRMALAAGAPEP
jgi:two-component system response regulator FixJ